MWGDDGLLPAHAVTLIVYLLAITRLTGLVTTDAITEAARDWVIGKLDDRPATLGEFVAKLITCSWCASIWVAAAAVPLIWFLGLSPWLLIPALALAASQVAGMLSELGR